MITLRRALLACLLLALAPVAPALAQPQAALTILHSNDTHGHLLPFSYPESALGGEARGLPTIRDIGGIARRATIAKRVREQMARRGTPVWLVDVGDYSDGTPFSTEYKGEADVAAMNAAGYDLGTLGNHEFNYRAAQVRRLVAEARYQVVTANVTERGSGRPLAEPFVVRPVGPVRVGVFGLTSREAAAYPAGKEAFDVADEVQAARETAAALHGKADILVLLSHAGTAVDEKIAAAVPEIDVIVGAHSHSRLPSGSFVWRSEDLLAGEVNGTVIVQAHQWGGELGRLDLLFSRRADGSWAVERYRARLLPVTPDIPEEPGVAGVVGEFWKPIAGTYGEVLGRAEGEFSSRGDAPAEYHLVADAVRETFGADFGLENMGGVRAPLIRGPVTRADLVAMDPFDNTVVRFQATGRAIKELLARYTPAVSGLRYRVESRRVVEATIGGRPLEDDRVYSGVTNSYFAGFALQGVAFEDTKRRRIETVVEYVRKQGTIRPSYDGRRVVIR